MVFIDNVLPISHVAHHEQCAVLLRAFEVELAASLSRCSVSVQLVVRIGSVINKTPYPVIAFRLAAFFKNAFA